jgi:hypothetical protein
VQIVRKTMATAMTDAMAVVLACDEASVLPIKPRDARAAGSALCRVGLWRCTCVSSIPHNHSKSLSLGKKEGFPSLAFAWKTIMGGSRTDPRHANG